MWFMLLGHQIKFLLKKAKNFTLLMLATNILPFHFLKIWMPSLLWCLFISDNVCRLETTHSTPVTILQVKYYVMYFVKYVLHQEIFLVLIKRTNASVLGHAFSVENES